MAIDILPKLFDSNKTCVAHSTVVPSLAVLEIMQRVQQLDDKTKEEIKAYLFSLFKDTIGCRTVESICNYCVSEMLEKLNYYKED